jgi:phosphohistidine phosphatase SixA
MIVFALRHADRASGGADALSPAGKIRAELLARMLAGSRIRLALCSDAARTRETLAPLTAAVGLQPREVATNGPNGIAGHISEVAGLLKPLPPRVVAIVAGHTNTVGPIITQLCGQTIDPIAEDEFDKLFVVTAIGGQGEVAQMRYGEKTP